MVLGRQIQYVIYWLVRKHQKLHKVFLGSVLPPTLYSLHMHDIPTSHSPWIHIASYTDNITLIASIHGPVCIGQLQPDVSNCEYVGLMLQSSIFKCCLVLVVAFYHRMVHFYLLQVYTTNKNISALLPQIILILVMTANWKWLEQ